MSENNFRYVYGPVSSWRLGSSLGIDPISAKEKICSFDCLYCQLGKTAVLTNERRVFVPTQSLIEEITGIPFPPLDYITFSGAGEPTLAKNLGAMIRAIRKIRREKIAVITNSSLLNRRDVQTDLLLADFVLAKLDAGIEETFQKINRPLPDLNLRTIVSALKGFRSLYKGRLALQIMFTTINEKDSREIAQLAAEIHPDEIEINTPLRPCALDPLAEPLLSRIEKQFLDFCGGGVPIINVYKATKKTVMPISAPNTLRRRGKPS